MNLEGTEENRPKKIRAFIALKTPPEWDAAFTALQDDLKGRLRSKAFRWTKPEQIHITLRFLGYIPPDAAVTVIERIHDELLPGRSAFTLRCGGLGCFPNLRRPRVFWAGVLGDTTLESLQAAVNQATRTIGEPPEDRPFKAHLTLARIQQAERSAIEQLERTVARGFMIESAWKVSELLLMQSHLSPNGACYEPLACWPLEQD